MPLSLSLCMPNGFALLQVGTQKVQEEVSEWFTKALGIKCWLVQQQAGSRRAVDREQLAGSRPALGSTPEQSSSPEDASSQAPDEAVSLSQHQTRSIGESLACARAAQCKSHTYGSCYLSAIDRECNRNTRPLLL